MSVQITRLWGVAFGELHIAHFPSGPSLPHGRLGLPGVFDGRHRFEIQVLPKGPSRLIQTERFRGLLVPVL